MRPLIFKIIATVAVLAVGVGSAGGMHYPTSGRWIGKSYADVDGAIANCVMAARYDNDHYLFFVLSKDFNWHLGVGNSSWVLATDDVVRVSVEIDGNFEFADDSLTMSETVLSVHLPSSDAFMSDLLNGDVITLGMGETKVTFGIKGIDVALHELEKCVQAGHAASQ